MSGQEEPANADQAAALALLCRFQQRWGAAAQLYADAFKSEPRLAADLEQQRRYNAAYCAASAASGQGEDARSLSDQERTRMRRQALIWLRDDLAAYTKLAEQDKSDENKVLQQCLTHWRLDADLASVRDASALDRLPEDERAAWYSLWRDVDELVKRVAKKDETIASPKTAKP